MCLAGIWQPSLGEGDIFPFCAVSLHLRSKTNLQVCCWSKQANQAKVAQASTLSNTHIPLLLPRLLTAPGLVPVLSRNCLTAAGCRERHSLSWDIFSCSSHERPTLLKLDSSSSCLGGALFSLLVPHPGPRHHLLKTQPFPFSCSEKAPTHLPNLEVSGLSLLIPHASYIIFQLVPSQNTTPCSTYSDPWHCPVLQSLQQRFHVSLDSFLPTDSNMTYLACTSDHALFY